LELIDPIAVILLTLITQLLVIFLLERAMQRARYFRAKVKAIPKSTLLEPQTSMVLEFIDLNIVVHSLYAKRDPLYTQSSKVWLVVAVL
jgi:hypothetical protein